MKLAALPHAGPNLIEFKGIGAALSSQPVTGTPSANDGMQFDVSRVIPMPPV